VPNFSTLSRRQKTLTEICVAAQPTIRHKGMHCFPITTGSLRPNSLAFEFW